MRLLVRLAVIAALAFTLAGTASADTYNFTCITNNSATSCNIGQNQLSVTVTAGSAAGTVQFQFNNVGTSAASITDVYFASNGFITPPLTITNSSGVDFSVVASPGSLPGAGQGFTTTSQLTADSNPPTQPNGVNPGETLIILANLATGTTFNQLITAMNGGQVVVGIHVQGFANGQSESFVNRPPTNVVPEPGTLALFGTGLVGLAGLVRKRLA